MTKQTKKPSLLLPLLFAVLGLGALAGSILLVPMIISTELSSKTLQKNARIRETTQSAENFLQQIKQQKALKLAAETELDQATPDSNPNPQGGAAVPETQPQPAAEETQPAAEETQPTAEETQPAAEKDQPTAEETPPEKEAPPTEAVQPTAADEPQSADQPIAAAEASASAATIGAMGERWTLILDPKNYEVVNTDQTKISEMTQALKSNPKLKIQLTGINDISRSSKRALRGANIVKKKMLQDKSISPWRVTVASKQAENMKGLIVEAQSLGGTK